MHGVHGQVVCNRSGRRQGSESLSYMRKVAAGIWCKCEVSASGRSPQGESDVVNERRLVESTPCACRSNGFPVTEYLVPGIMRAELHALAERKFYPTDSASRSSTLVKAERNDHSQLTLLPGPVYLRHRHLRRAVPVVSREESPPGTPSFSANARRGREKSLSRHRLLRIWRAVACHVLNLKMAGEQLRGRSLIAAVLRGHFAPPAGSLHVPARRRLGARAPRAPGIEHP